MPTVMIVEDDADFRELLADIFQVSPNYTVIQTFSSLEAFADFLPNDIAQAQGLIADLVCIDVFCSTQKMYGSPTQNGANVSFYLRTAGLRFAVLLMSSGTLTTKLSSPATIALGGWAFLVKRSTLTVAEVLGLADTAIASLRVDL